MAQGRGAALSALAGAGPVVGPEGDARANEGESVAPSVNRRARGPSNQGNPTSTRDTAPSDREHDLRLIERARDGDGQAFKELVERHQRRAYAIARGLVRDDQDAREVVQEAFLRVYRGLDSFQGGASFFTWLYRIVTNLSIDLLRRPARREAGTEADRLEQHLEAGLDSELTLFARRLDADPLDAVRRQEIARRIQGALDDLPPYHRAVIVMREFEGMSYEQMAQAMDVSKGTIMSRLFHARQKLQRALADCYAEHLGAPPEGAGTKGAGTAASAPSSSGRKS